MNEIIQCVFINEEKSLHQLTNKQLLELYKYFHIKTKGRSKYLLIKHLLPLKIRYRRIKQLEDSNYSEECPICYDTIKPNDYVITKCCHIFCQECIIKHIIIGNNHFCPYCRRECVEKEVFDLPLSSEILERMGILKMTNDILDTGLIILQHLRYQQYITDSNMIQLIREYQFRQQYANKIIICIKFVFMMMGIWFLTTI